MTGKKFEVVVLSPKMIVLKDMYSEGEKKDSYIVMEIPPNGQEWEVSRTLKGE